MKAQQYLIRTWTIVSLWLSQLVLALAARRSALCVALLALVICFCLLSLSMFHLSAFSSLHSLTMSALHTLQRVPYGDPYP